jgi:hypothetical protein
MLNLARTALEKEPTMLAMAGKYIVYIEKSRLILMHPTGVSFDLTREDAMELAVLVNNWQLAMAYKGELEAKQIGEDENDKV